MKKFFLLLLTICFISTNALAGIAIFPKAVDFPDGSRKRSQTLHVLNTSKTMTQTYRVRMEEYTQDEDGKYHKAEIVPNSAKKYLIYSPKQFTLAPGKLQAIRVARKGLSDVEDGEYVSHLLVSEIDIPHASQNAKITKDDSQAPVTTDDENKHLNISLKALFAVSVPVTIYKGDNLKQATEILSYKQNGDELDLVLQRKGNISSRLKINVLDDKDEIIGEASLVRIYTPNGKLKMSIKLEKGKKPVKLELYDVLSKKKLSEKAL